MLLLILLRNLLTDAICSSKQRLLFMLALSCPCDLVAPRSLPCPHDGMVLELERARLSYQQLRRGLVCRGSILNV